jgi:hypothetical protein
MELKDYFLRLENEREIYFLNIRNQPLNSCNTSVSNIKTNSAKTFPIEKHLRRRFILR